MKITFAQKTNRTHISMPSSRVHGGCRLHSQRFIVPSLSLLLTTENNLTLYQRFMHQEHPSDHNPVTALEFCENIINNPVLSYILFCEPDFKFTGLPEEHSNQNRTEIYDYMTPALNRAVEITVITDKKNIQSEHLKSYSIQGDHQYYQFQISSGNKDVRNLGDQLQAVCKEAKSLLMDIPCLDIINKPDVI